MVVDNHHSKLAVILIAGILGIFVVCLFMALSSFIFKGLEHFVKVQK
jgi:hypothetical protein